ncbi:MAG: cation diffusion facilitator family transporter [Candidatus Thorarchaeota archaeon]
MNKKQAATIAIIGGLAVFCIKIAAYLISNSVALLSDALESIVNIIASLIMISSVYISERPADDTHNYGHQKIEDISSALEGIFILAAALLIVGAASSRILEPVLLLDLNFGIVISIIATAINGCISILLMRIAKSSNSMALDGDAKHLLSDVISSLGVWIGLVIVQLTGWTIMDSLVAFVIAALIARMGIGLMIRSARHLMDQSCEVEERIIREVLETLKSSFIEFHDLKTRRQGNLVLADVHITVKDSLSVRNAHDIIDALEVQLREVSPHIIMTVHIDPESELGRIES